MKEQLITRLQTLKQEYETGQKMLADLELKHLATISGAIQVIEEMLAEDGAGKGGEEQLESGVG